MVATIHDVAQCRDRLSGSDRGGQFGEGPFAVTVSEAIESEGRDSSIHQERSEGVVARAVLVRQKPMAEHCGIVGCLVRSGKHGCNAIAGGVMKK